MDALRTTALEFVRSLHAPATHGRYRFSPSASFADLYGTCYAILIRMLVRDELETEEREALAECVQAYQQERTGMFLDPQTAPANNTQRTWSYISAEMTHLCLTALSELAVEPRHRLRVMQLVGQRPEAVRNWFTQIEWSKLWRGRPTDMAEWNGHEILNFGGMLIGAAQSGQATWEAVAAMMACLDETVDPLTGLWGMDKGCAKRGALVGAGAITRLYLCLGRPARFPIDLSDAVETQLDTSRERTRPWHHLGLPHLLCAPGEDHLLAVWLRCVAAALSTPTDWKLRGLLPLNCWQ